MFYSHTTVERTEQLSLKTRSIMIRKILTGALLFLLGSCATNIPTSTMDTSVMIDTTADSLLEEYQIGVGDSLQVSVWRNPELSAQVVVLPDGAISVPLAGDVRAAGETTTSLAAQISSALDAFIRQPEVTISVVNAVSAEYLQRIRITGAVLSPVSMNYRRGLTVLDVVLLAGGITQFANANKALLYRKEGEELKIYPVRLEDILSGGKLETNYSLLPSDIITVPERSF